MSPAKKSEVGERLPYLLSKMKAPRVLERLAQTAERAGRRRGGARHRTQRGAAPGRGGLSPLRGADGGASRPPEPQAATLLCALISRRYERGSIIVTSNRSFEQWGEILGDAMVAAALIDRLVHHATMITLKGKSYRLRERGLDVVPAAQAPSLRDST